MGEGIYQDPSETLHGKNAGMDDMGDNIYQDPTTTIETRKPTDPFGDDDVYQDPTTVQSTKKPDDRFGEDSIYKDPTLTEKTNISEEDLYEDLSSIQTAVKENKSKKTESNDNYPRDTLRSSSPIPSVVSKQGTLTRQMSPSMGKRPYKPGHSRVRMQGSTSDEVQPPSETRRQAPTSP